jgi:DNA-binding Lrp family transcriptional regulator
MKYMKKRGESIDIKILDILKKQPHPISTREISINTKLSWHTVINHCLRLQMAGKVDGYKIGNLNVWGIKK